MSQVYSAIQSNLSNNFIKSNFFAQEATVALLAGISPLWYGKGGLGKTEMILEVLRTLETSSGMLECHPEMGVSDLFGGAVAATEIERTYDNDNHLMIGVEKTRASVDYSRGLLSHKVFFLEEMLDCPMPVLAALKAVMTNKMWDGVKSQNKLILGATNINPYHLVEEFPTTYKNSYEALLQRFLVIEHHWQGTEPQYQYQAQGYLELLDFKKKVAPRRKVSEGVLSEEMRLVQSVAIPYYLKGALASLASKSSEQGSFVSPRTLMWAVRLLQSSAFMENRSSVEESDFSVLYLVKSFMTSCLEELSQEIQKQRETKRLETELDGFNSRFRTITQAWGRGGDKHVLALSIAKAGSDLRDEVQNWSTNDAFSARKGSLIEQIGKEIDKARNAANEAISYIDL